MVLAGVRRAGCSVARMRVQLGQGERAKRGTPYGTLCGTYRAAQRGARRGAATLGRRRAVRGLLKGAAAYEKPRK